MYGLFSDETTCEVTELLKDIKEMLDYKIHSDYLLVTGSNLVAPWDKDQPEEEEPDLVQVDAKSFLTSFLQYYCCIEEGAATRESYFVNTIQAFCAECEVIPLRAQEIREAMEELSETMPIKFVKGTTNMYEGFRITGGK